jgi:hypothetical protein
MQNKMKLFLMMVMVFGGGFLMTEQVLAAPCTCGSSNGRTFSTIPTDNLCPTGISSSSPTTTTTGWQWSCALTGTCESVPCSATKSGTTGSTDNCTSGTCKLATSCKSAGVGTCKDSTNECCLDSGGGGGGGVDIPTDTGLPANPDLVKGILTNVVDWLLSIVGIIAIIGFIISGFQYFLVATDEKMVEKAKKTMVASIIGLVVALSGFIAIKTVDFLLR